MAKGSERWRLSVAMGEGAKVPRKQPRKTGSREKSKLDENKNLGCKRNTNFSFSRGERSDPG